ncbi:MAG: hypothetical protein K2G90_10070, partial [Muribaculaceae bacterium]|nr:hypothetical protein [Muribaculaceae bacterium]
MRLTTLRFILTFITAILSGYFRTACAELPWPERNIWPDSPQTTAIRQVMMPSPSLVTGAVELSVPVYTINTEGLEIPVGFHYRSNGIRLTDSAEPIGYGWILDPPLRITREIQGYPDEIACYKGDAGQDYFFNDYFNGYRAMNLQGQWDA